MECKTVQRIAGVVLVGVASETAVAVKTVTNQNCLPGDARIRMCEPTHLGIEPPNVHVPQGEFDTGSYASVVWLVSGGLASSTSTSHGVFPGYHLVLAGEGPAAHYVAHIKRG